MGKMKKYKGHTIIELKDPETGEVVKRVESDNMFTNAINKMVDFALRHAYGTSGLQNMYTSHLWFFTGIIGWNGTIEEDEDNFWPPAGVFPTVYGATGVANSSAAWLQMGTYDNTESDTSQALVKKFVWNFTKAQGNGRISCITLIPRPMAFGGHGGPEDWAESINYGQPYYYPVVFLNRIMTNAGGLSRVTPNSGANYALYAQVNTQYADFCLDSENDQLWKIKVGSDEVSVVHHDIDPKYFDVFRDASSLQERTEETYQISFSGSYFDWYYNTDEKKCYFWPCGTGETYGNGTEYPVYAYDIVNKTVTRHGTWRNQTGNNVVRKLVVTNDAVYEMAYYNGNVYKYSFALSPTSVGSTTLLRSLPYYSSQRHYYNKARCWNLNGKIYIPFGIVTNNGYQGGRGIIIDTSNDSVRACMESFYIRVRDENYATVVPPISKDQVAFYSAGGTNSSLDGVNDSYQSCMNMEGGRTDNGNTFTPVCFLSTINNLPEPVVKDATKTMTITYIIEAAEV